MSEAQASDERDGSDSSPGGLVAGLVALMELEQLDRDLFRGPRTHEPWPRVFGGQVIGQALMAAARTVDPARLPHSLHAYFLRPGDPGLPIVYQVSRDRDGRSFSPRRVVALQDGKPILNMSASFQIEEEGPHHQFDMPEGPGPEGLRDDRSVIMEHLDLVAPELRPTAARKTPIEFRAVDQELRFTKLAAPPHQNFWFRAVAPVPDDQLLQRVLLAYASDTMLLTVGLLPHSSRWDVGRVAQASIDHALWIHDEFRIDDWLLYVQDSPWAGRARAMCRGLIYTRDGRLVATVAQEGLFRVLAEAR